MRESEKILKSLLLAGVEWELASTISYDNKVINESQSYVVPKSTTVITSANIIDIAKTKADAADICAGIMGFKEHPLYSSAKNTVLPMLCPDAKLLIITDIPSASDDANGKILSGEEGELFDKILNAKGLTRADVAITPLIFWRTAGGRTPTKDELSFCKPFIEKIISSYGSGKILTLGNLAAKEIAGAILPRDHGKEFGNVIPIYKMDFILQNPCVKKDVWNALQRC